MNVINNEKFTWEEFYERFTKNYEEFTFIYKDKELNLLNWFGGQPCYSYGTKENGYEYSKKYKTPNEFLDNAQIEGKTLQEIWEDLR